jgi:putative membrane protein
VTTAEGANQYEIEAGRLAERQGRSRVVRTFGRDMVRDHTRIGREMDAAVRRDKGANLPATTPIPADLQQKLDQLKSERGADFDRDYARQALETHQQAVALFQNYVKNGEDHVVKIVAGRALPIIREHLRMSERLARQLGVKAPPSNS